VVISKIFTMILRALKNCTVETAVRYYKQDNTALVT